jgi:hypothetical protein
MGEVAETYVWRWAATNVPRPWMVLIKPRSLSTFMARRSVR